MQKTLDIQICITNLINLVVDTVGQRIGPHADIQVGVTEPLHRLLHIGDGAQSHLEPEETTLSPVFVAIWWRRLLTAARTFTTPQFSLVQHIYK